MIRLGVLEPIVKSTLREPYNAPRQSLPKSYWQTGHVDAARSSTILQHGSMTGERILPIVVDASYALNIDEPFHWRLAEELLAYGNLDVVAPAGQSVAARLQVAHAWPFRIRGLIALAI